MNFVHYKPDYDEYRKHWLFKLMRQFVIDRSGGVCERCKKKPVTEVHHNRYPKWGTFDVPSNLEALCHECHCKRHGKEK